MPDISVVVPVYNEEGSVNVLFEEIKRSIEAVSMTFEVIFVNDCSDDLSLNKLKALKEDFPGVVCLINLKQRCGQTFALKSGLHVVKGDIAVTMDADLQNDPSDLPKILQKLESGFDCVCGWRKSRQDTFLKAVLSKSGNIFQRILTGLKIHDVSCTLRAYKKDCINKIPLNWEGQHRFIPLSLSLQGYKVDEIVSNHRKREYGYSKYSHKRIFRVIFDFFKILSSRGRA